LGKGNFNGEGVGQSRKRQCVTIKNRILYHKFQNEIKNSPYSTVLMLQYWYISVIYVSWHRGLLTLYSIVI